MAWHEGRRESPFVLPVYTGGMQPQPLRGADIALVGFEFLVAFLQAYVFAILTSIYLHDAVHLH